MRIFTFKRKLTALALFILTIGSIQAQSFSESFNDISILASSGWVMINASTPVGATNWFQGTPVSGGGPFDSYNGAANAYIAANFNNTGNTGTISNWLLTPNRTYKNGDVITFYTRKATPDTYADRLEVRLSTNGSSTNVGTGTGTGDFTTLLLSINPTLIIGIYPTVWTQYSITISGLPAPTSGRVAFRYFVTGAGLSGTASDYIGIDQVDYTSYVCPTFTMTSAGALSSGTAGSEYSTLIAQTGALGIPYFALTAGALPDGLILLPGGIIFGTPTATGTFNFTVTVSDASGCSGSQNYSITIVCPADPTSLNGLPTLCSNDAPIILTQGLPVGGTYSGTGVTAGMFDPSVGTQTIQYNYTEPYGCAFSTTNTIYVNTAPTVTFSPLAAVCDNGGMVTLSGGSPTGGTYSGTGVSSGMFDPAFGTQNITYTYTDGNGCSNAASQTLTVNIASSVSLNPFAEVCDNGGMVTLSGGSPTGGTYSGTGVSGGMFDPAFGSQAITYSYTDTNFCSNSATQNITVNIAPIATLNLPVTLLCIYNSAITLSGGSPAGGTYSGNGVSGNSFDPTTAGIGTSIITYTITDGNGCTDSVTQSIIVDACTGVPENGGAVVSVTPNPSTGTFIITGIDVNKLSDISLLDMNGREVSTNIHIINTSKMTLDLNTESTGIYLFTAWYNDQLILLKLLKN